MTTIVDIKNALLTHFLTQSSFSFPDDLKSIKIDPKDGSPDFVEYKEDIVRLALEEYVKGALVAKANDNLYVLVQPINNLNQSVVVSPLTALMLANLVNDYMVHSGERKATGYVVNILSITDRDIQTLCQLCHTIMSADEDDGQSPGPTEAGPN